MANGSCNRADPAKVEACFDQALVVARRQQARSYELRAATQMSRLWQSQGKRAEARALLAPVYDWFTERLTPRTCKTPEHCLTPCPEM